MDICDVIHRSDSEMIKLNQYEAHRRQKVFFFILMYEGMRACTWRAVIHYNGSLSSMMQHYSRALGKDRQVGFKAFVCEEKFQA